MCFVLDEIHSITSNSLLQTLFSNKRQMIQPHWGKFSTFRIVILENKICKSWCLQEYLTAISESHCLCLTLIFYSSSCFWLKLTLCELCYSILLNIACSKIEWYSGSCKIMKHIKKNKKKLTVKGLRTWNSVK